MSNAPSNATGRTEDLNTCPLAGQLDCDVCGARPYTYHYAYLDGEDRDSTIACSRECAQVAHDRHVSSS